MVLKLCPSVVKGLKLKVRKFFGANSYVCESYKGKTGRGSFFLPPPSYWITISFPNRKDIHFWQKIYILKTLGYWCQLWRYFFQILLSFFFGPKFKVFFSFCTKFCILKNFKYIIVFSKLLPQKTQILVSCLNFFVYFAWHFELETLKFWPIGDW